VSILAALATAGLLAAVIPPPGVSGEARVQATTASFDVATGTYRLEGDVVISRGGATLRAGKATYDPRTGEVTASGGILLVDPTRVLSAEEVHAVLNGPFEAHQVVALYKLAPVPLGSSTTLAEAARCGRNAMRAEGREVSSLDGGRLRLQEARMSLCDCPDDGAPSWELRAGAAIVQPGESARLEWPVLYVTPRFLFIDHPVPVMALPWFTVPLAPRVSGLLVPQLTSTGPTGWTVSQPVFLTLGRTADLTLTPGYAFGQGAAAVAAGTASVRGPGLSLEGRWAPAPEAGVMLRVDLQQDLDDEAVPSQGIVGASGLRYAVRSDWSQRFAGRTALRLSLDVVGDPLYVRDFNPDVRIRDATSRRSALVVSHGTDDLVFELTAGWLQPVARNGSLSAIDNGLFGAALPAFQRWPSLAVTLAPVRVGGPFLLSGRAGATRAAPVHGPTSDGGADGIGPADRSWQRDAADPTELDGVWQPGERLGVSRLDARAELAAPLRLGWLSATPWVRATGLAYAFDAGAAARANGWWVAGMQLSTLLSRRFGELRHVIEPRLEWLLASPVAGPGLPAFGTDAWDRAAETPAGATAAFVAPRYAAAAPPGRSNQLRLAVASWLHSPAFAWLRGEVGQDVDLGRGKLAEGFVNGAASRGYVTGEAEVRFWTAGRIEPAVQPSSASWLDRFSLLRVRLSLDDGRGDGVHGGLLAFGPGGSAQMGAGVDALFDPRSIAISSLDPIPGTDSGPYVPASATLGAKVRIGPASFGYDVLMPARTTVVGACQAGGQPRTIGPWHFQQQNGWAQWDSPCRCFKLKVAVGVSDCGGIPSFKVELGLGQVGATRFQ
jgi:LPS-assembly protein